MGMLPDGFKSIINFVGRAPGAAGVWFLEKEVQPPGWEVGKIDVTTMRSIIMRNSWHKSLISLDDSTIQAAYDPVCFNATQLTGLLGLNGLIQFIFPDLTMWTISGWLDSLKPTSLKEGEFPLMEMKIVASNFTITNGVFLENRPFLLGGISMLPSAFSYGQ